MSYMPSYNVTEDKQAEPADLSDITSKRTHLDDSNLPDLARCAREQRGYVLQEIAALDKLLIAPEKTFDDNIPFSKAAVQLSNPAFCSELPFPSVEVVLGRFKGDHNDVKSTWSYMGTKLVKDFEMVRKSCSYIALWVYGTRDDGKSHLLATLVCLLAAQGKCVVYIPDYRKCVTGFLTIQTI